MNQWWERTSSPDRLLIENADSRSSKKPQPRHARARPCTPVHARARPRPRSHHRYYGRRFFFFKNLVQSAGVHGGLRRPPSSCGSIPGRGLELGGGRRFGGGHDLHVLCEDGLEGFVSVNHGAKHQRLKIPNRCVSAKHLKRAIALKTSQIFSV